MDALDRLRTRLGERRLFASARARRRFLAHVAVAVAVLVAASLIVHRHLSVLTDPARLRAFVRGYGIWAPLVFVCLQALQVVVAPIPGHVMAVVSGYLFGAWWGAVYNLVGLTIGSTLAFWLSRRFGRAYVERIVHEEALARFDALGDDYARPVLLAFFLVPGLPDDVLCFAGGLTRIPLWQLVVLAVVGRAPAFVLATLVGDLLGTDRILGAAVVAAVLAVAAVVGYLNRDRLVRLFGGDP
ncbi:MAG: TVP38/TMEM64 family protein [Haloferacaceae archaeon]